MKAHTETLIYRVTTVLSFIFADVTNHRTLGTVFSRFQKSGNKSRQFTNYRTLGTVFFQVSKEFEQVQRRSRQQRGEKIWTVL